MIFETPAGRDGALTALDVVAHLPRSGEPVSVGADHRYICNPGSVGQPRDADPRASFAVLDLDEATFTVHREEYRCGPTGDPSGGIAHGARRPPRHRRIDLVRPGRAASLRG
jgi:hypothetical protein